jgi:hypothetical protein
MQAPTKITGIPKKTIANYGATVKAGATSYRYVYMYVHARVSARCVFFFYMKEFPFPRHIKMSTCLHACIHSLYEHIRIPVVSTSCLCLRSSTHTHTRTHAHTHTYTHTCRVFARAPSEDRWYEVGQVASTPDRCVYVCARARMINVRTFIYTHM